MRPTTVAVDGAATAIEPGVARVGPWELTIAVDEADGTTTISIDVENVSPDPATVGAVRVALDRLPEQVLEQGWQSWSVVRRCPPADVRPERTQSSELARATHMADLALAGTHVVGDQVMVTSDGVIGFLGGDRHFGTVAADGEGIEAIALLDGVVVAPGERRSLHPLWIGAGDPGARYSELVARWAAVAGARATSTAPTGWCSWYEFFHDVTPDDVRRSLPLAVDLGLDVVQVDDGWQAAIGDWTAVSERWGVDMRTIAGEIAAAGATPGIWTAPFLAAETSRVASEHPDWIAVHRSGRPLRGAFNPAWGGAMLALDTTNPAVLAHLREAYARLRADGFEYHKIDFCYAAAIPARRHDPSRTRAQALRAGLDAVRDGIGDDAFLLGCGCPFGPAVGVVDAMRVSADVAPVWAPDAHWPGFVETPPAALNAIKASVLRAPMHRRLFINDPDCLLVRRDALTTEQRAVLADTIVGTGGFVVVSDDLARYGDDERAALADAIARRRDFDAPLDIDDPFATPVVVRAPGHRLTIHWDAVSSAIS